VSERERERKRENKRERDEGREREGIFISKPYLKCSKDSFEIEVFEYNKSVLPSFPPFGWFQHLLLLLLLLLLCLTIQLLSPLCPKASSSPTISSVFLFQIVRVCECVCVRV
jgi:hypothetical protein